MAKRQLDQIQAALGLAKTSSSGVRFGEVDGFATAATFVKNGNYDQLVVVIGYNADGRRTQIEHELDGAPDLAAAGLKRKLVKVDERTVTVTVPPRAILGLPKTDVVVARVRAVLSALTRAVPDNRRACRECHAEKADVTLLRGTPDRVCASCAERLAAESRAVAEAYHAATANLPLSLIFALGAGAAGAALYGGVLIGTNRMFWVLAILTGAMVGWAAIKGAGKSNKVVQGIAAVVTVLSVLVGLLAFIGWTANEAAQAEGKTIDWLVFLRLSPQLLIESGADTLFSLAGGIFGALSAIKKAAPPDFTVVEGSPGLQP